MELLVRSTTPSQATGFFECSWNILLLGFFSSFEAARVLYHLRTGTKIPYSFALSPWAGFCLSNAYKQYSLIYLRQPSNVSPARESHYTPKPETMPLQKLKRRMDELLIMFVLKREGFDRSRSQCKLPMPPSETTQWRAIAVSAHCFVACRKLLPCLPRSVHRFTQPFGPAPEDRQWLGRG